MTAFEAFKLTPAYQEILERNGVKQTILTPEPLVKPSKVE